MTDYLFVFTIMLWLCNISVLIIDQPGTTQHAELFPEITFQAQYLELWVYRYLDIYM